MKWKIYATLYKNQWFNEEWKFIPPWFLQVLWPNGTFFIQLRNAQSEDDSESITSRTDGSKIPKPGSFELQLEAARRASDVKKMLLGQ